MIHILKYRRYFIQQDVFLDQVKVSKALNLFCELDLPSEIHFLTAIIYQHTIISISDQIIQRHFIQVV